MTGEALVRVDGVHKHFPVPVSFLSREKPVVHALNGVSLEIARGEAFCVVGESGCGKTTLGRAIMGLIGPTRGSISYDDTRIDALPEDKMLAFRRRMQMVFQNPYASLNPRMTVRRTLEEPLRFHRPDMTDGEVRDHVESVMRSVGMDLAWGSRYPHEFSGGQRQRISIARALMVDPEFIVADEPVSALDVSVQAQVLNLLMTVRKERGLTYLFITHDLSVVEHFGTQVAVMYLGVVCEIAPTADLFAAPRHPYTRLLLSAIPKLDRKTFEAVRIPGELPSPLDPPPGCVFHTRCPHATDLCRRERPELRSLAGRSVACHHAEEIGAG
ncbi:MAG: ATP-binding cassette domain-containing protein [Alphaproteobacteria bacterium]|nr:ATP-binding cassette domain-containing protein [Alphaproteobacteria bacterium]